MSAWLRRLATFLARVTDRFEVGSSGTHDEYERVFQLRTRIHCGYY